jgi:hypothetical protein
VTDLLVVEDMAVADIEPAHCERLDRSLHHRHDYVHRAGPPTALADPPETGAPESAVTSADRG